MKLINNKILVKREEVKKSTVWVPEGAIEKPKQGVIVMHGDSNKDGKPFATKVGDVVIFPAFSGTEITVEGKAYLVMTEDDILVIL